MPLCPDCSRALAPLRAERRCAVCSLPLISEHEVCTRCRRRRFAFTANVSCFAYDGVAQAVVRAFKFGGHHRLLQRIAGDLAGVLPADWRHLPIVPAPARRSSVRRREYEPVHLLATTLSTIHAVPVLRLLRRREGTSQKQLGFEARLNNVVGKFVPTAAAARLADRLRLPSQVLLVDDVFTTGATAHECANVLASVGVETVYVATVAIEQ